MGLQETSAWVSLIGGIVSILYVFFDYFTSRAEGRGRHVSGRPVSLFSVIDRHSSLVAMGLLLLVMPFAVSPEVYGIFGASLARFLPVWIVFVIAFLLLLESN